jgi:hypothetical protein
MKLLPLKFLILTALVLVGSAHAQDLDLIGNAGWSKSGARIRIYADQIHNYRETGTSGALRLQIWATTDPYDVTNNITGYVIGTANLRSLVAGGDHFDVVRNVRYRRPPPGYYFTTITLEEKYSDGSWLIIDSENFSGVVNLGGFGEGLVNLELSTTSDISFEGDVSWLSGDKRVQLYAERIHNVRSSGRSGYLRVRLFASDEPYDPAQEFSAYPMATKGVGRIYAQSAIEFYPRLTRFRPPPAGEWYVTITLEEYNRGWYIRDYYTFLDPRLF